MPPPLVEPADPAPTVAWTPPAASPVPPADAAHVAPPAAPSTPADWDQPTQLMDAVEADAAPAPLPPAAASELAQTELLGAAALAADPGTTSGLDSLFGEANFHDYEAEPAPSESPFVRAPQSDGPQPPRDGVTRRQKVLLAIAGGLVAVLALVALFLLGTRLPAILASGEVPEPVITPSDTPTPTPTEAPVGPVAPGVWAWDALLGGECLDPYTDPWAEEFTVVDCADPHPAQLVYRGVFPPSAEGVTNDPFPGTQALQGQLSLLCTAPGVVDLAAAGQYPDVQFQGSYPATQEQWDAGERSYYCFVSRSSGEPLTGSIAVPPAPAADTAG